MNLKYLERCMQEAEEDYANGLISISEYNDIMRELDGR